MKTLYKRLRVIQEVSTRMAQEMSEDYITFRERYEGKDQTLSYERYGGPQKISIDCMKYELAVLSQMSQEIHDELKKYEPSITAEMIADRLRGEIV